MCDSTISTNPTRIFFTVDKDEEWKKITLDSFVRSTADDVTIDDELDNILANPEGISVRRIVNDWFKENPKQHNSQLCELCSESKFQLKLGLYVGTSGQIDCKSFDLKSF